MRIAESINEAELLRVACDLVRRSDRHAVTEPVYAEQLARQACELGRHSKYVKRQMVRDKVLELQHFSHAASSRRRDLIENKPGPASRLQEDISLRRLLDRQKSLLRQHDSVATIHDHDKRGRWPRRLFTRLLLLHAIVVASLLAGATPLDEQPVPLSVASLTKAPL